MRVKDVEFSRREILVRDGKGGKDRVTMLPVRLAAPLREQLAHARELHRVDLDEGFGAVRLPFALDRKYPGAAVAASSARSTRASRHPLPASLVIRAGIHSRRTRHR